MRYHKIINGESAHIESCQKVKSGIATGPDGYPVWRLEVEDPRPDYNGSIQTLTRVETVEPDRYHITWAVTDRDLATVKADLKNRIDHDAEQQRMTYLTGGEGQAQEYIEALKQAEGYQADPAFTPIDMLQASVDAGESPDVATAAAVVVGSYAAYRAIGATVREKRLAGKRGVDATTSVTDAWAAYQSVEWGG